MLTLRQNRSDPRRLLLALSDFYLLVELGIVIGTESLGDICDSVKNNQPLSRKAMVGESGEDDL